MTPSGGRSFQTTRWSLVRAARRGGVDTSAAREAFGALCEAYWRPLRAYVRSRGYAEADAEDLTQAFFARVTEVGGFVSADPGRGRFRSYLLGAMKHFMANEWHRTRAQKRGGGAVLIELDALDEGARRAVEPAVAAEAEVVFDRAWAREVMARSLARLEAEYVSRGTTALLTALRPVLEGGDVPRNEAAAALGMSEGALKVAVHRLRRRYGELVRAEIADTVAAENDIEDEIRHLVAVLREDPGRDV